MKMRFLSILVITGLLSFTSSRAQGIYLESVEGLAGSIDDSTIIADGATNVIFRFKLIGLNIPSFGLTAGFRVYSDDGATWTTTEFDTLNIGTPWANIWDSPGGYFENDFSVTGSNADTIGIGAFGVEYGLPDGFDAVAFSITIGPIAAEHEGKTICVDSCFYPPVGYWILSGCPEESFEWSGPHRFTLVTPTGVADQGDGLPGSFSLRQNYPNPFNPATEILFDVPTRSQVTISVFNVLGRQVRTLVDERLAPGSYSRTWDGTNDNGEGLPTGIYFCRMVTQDFRQARKMILLK